MAWARKPLAVNDAEQEHSLVGLELNATCARAVIGEGQLLPRALPLDGSREPLPMMLSLQGRQPEVGRAGAALCRQSPHLVCSDFLVCLGEARRWAAGRHHLDAARAASLVFERIYPPCGAAKGIVLVVPAYVTRPQVTLLGSLAEKARLQLLGSMAAPLASAWTAYLAEPWSGVALLVDADDHALSASQIAADGEQLWVQTTQTWSHLNLRAWKERLLDRIADRCVHQSRRDPRDSAEAEQSLFDQLEVALDNSRQGKVAELLIQTAHWYQNLLLQPEEIVASCARLVRQALESIRDMLASCREVPAVAIVTRSAGRLPGLLPALQGFVSEPAPDTTPEASEDFGEALLQPGAGAASVVELPSNAAAQAAQDLAVRIHRGWLPRGHFDRSVPLPSSDPQSPALKQTKRNFRILSADS
jgi:hypothetical protein